jgi:2-oxoglutarate ferredoxin oxidoreductase subunit alpha
MEEHKLVVDLRPQARTIHEHIVEIVSDSGEGAQKAGETFGTICAKMGNGVWTVQIIPAEIQPPARSPAGASGIRIRLASHYVTNMGDEADLVVAFNEQVLYSRIANGAYKQGTVVLLEDKWREDPVPEIREQYAKTVAEYRENGLVVHELSIEKACLAITDNPRQGKNMFVLGMLCHIYSRDLEQAREEIANTFKRKSEKVIALNQALFDAGQQFAREHLDFHYQVPPRPEAETKGRRFIVTDGNEALGLGVMAAGIELVAMYPITPATSASHYLAEVFHRVGGFVHQAEDEIAAIGFAIGASYAGKTACTITSGPGLALKTELLGLAVMAEVPLVVAVVQRGGPSTGLPTKVEQGDLLATLFGQPGDSPKVVIAATTIEECLHFVIMARRLAETFRTPVVLLTDTNLATGVQPYLRPEPTADWLAPPIDQSEWDESIPPYDWDPETGLSPRPIPGMPGGQYVLTGLAHTTRSLRLGLQSKGLQHAQPKACCPGQHPQATQGIRRRAGRSPGGGLGLDPGRDRRGGGPGPGTGPQGLLAATAFPLPPGTRSERDLPGFPQGHDSRDQLQRRPKRPPHHRGDPPLRPARLPLASAYAAGR